MKSREIIVVIVIIIIAFLLIDWLYKPNYFAIMGGQRMGWMYIRPEAAKLIINYFDQCARCAHDVYKSNKALNPDENGQYKQALNKKQKYISNQQNIDELNEFKIIEKEYNKKHSKYIDSSVDVDIYILNPLLSFLIL